MTNFAVLDELSNFMRFLPLFLRHLFYHQIDILNRVFQAFQAQKFSFLTRRCHICLKYPENVRIECKISKYFKPLLDKVMSHNQCHIGPHQHHLMLKELDMRPYMVTKRRYVQNKTFLLGPIVWNKVILCCISPLFIMFLYIREMATKTSNEVAIIF